MTDDSHMPIPSARLGRRKLLRCTLSLAGVAVVAVRGHPARAQGAVPKAAAKYQDHPNGQQHCTVCINFVPPSSCRVVAGTISPNGWCQFFTAKSPKS